MSKFERKITLTLSKSLFASALGALLIICAVHYFLQSWTTLSTVLTLAILILIPIAISHIWAIGKVNREAKMLDQHCRRIVEKYRNKRTSGWSDSDDLAHLKLRQNQIKAELISLNSLIFLKQNSSKEDDAQEQGIEDMSDEQLERLIDAAVESEQFETAADAQRELNSRKNAKRK